MKRTIASLMLIIIISLVVSACAPGGQTQPTTVPAATQPPAMEDTQAPAADGYMVAPVTDGGVVSGKISYSGPPVEPEVVTVDKDTDKCGESQEVVKVKTDTSGGLADAVVRITDIKSGKALDELGSVFELDQEGCQYIPAVLIVPVGKEVTIKNSDAILHNVHTTPFDNAPLNVAQPATQPEMQSPAFTIPENIEVGCDVHKWMHANIIVVDQPYVVVTGADGSFTLTDVPPGDYTLEVWHKELGTQTVQVTVTAGQEATADVEFK